MREEAKDQSERFILNTVGSNDKYLINKLKSYKITVDRIDSYLGKLEADCPLTNGQKL